MTSWTIPAALSTTLEQLARFLDARVRPLFALVFGRDSTGLPAVFPACYGGRSTRREGS